MPLRWSQGSRDLHLRTFRRNGQTIIATHSSSADTPSQTQRRRLITWGLLRAATTTVVVVALYFLAPLDRVVSVPLVVPLVIALLALLGVAIWQIRAIVQSPLPGIRAIEALAITAPLFLLLFAATYYLMANADPTSFSSTTLTRTDSLYFTVTTFATVGFGDITATSQSARLLVTVQMVLNLIVLGAGLKVFLGAVQRSRQRREAEPLQ